jgi:ferredoxin-NADP reductase
MKTTLESKEEVATGTMLFRFVKPEGFTYQAGQTVDITLIDPPETDVEGNKRTFSIASSPQDTTIAIATRMRDTSFKRTLKDMPLGTPIQIEGPIGSFTLHENATRPAVMLAGGIGITPFHSIILDATARKVPHSLILFYSNRRPEDAVFLRELTECAATNNNFTFVATMTDNEVESTWGGERGYIDSSMLERHIPPQSLPIYYLAGPQGMVTAMRTMLNEAGISNDDIRFEEFAGY